MRSRRRMQCSCADKRSGRRTAHTRGAASQARHTCADHRQHVAGGFRPRLARHRLCQRRRTERETDAAPKCAWSCPAVKCEHQSAYCMLFHTAATDGPALATQRRAIAQATPRARCAARLGRCGGKATQRQRNGNVVCARTLSWAESLSTRSTRCTAGRSE